MVRIVSQARSVEADWQNMYHYTAASLGARNQMRRSALTGDEQAVLVSRRCCMPICHGKEYDFHVRSRCGVVVSTYNLQQRLFVGRGDNTRCGW